MCRTCYCDKCNSECYICGNCERPISMDTYNELEGVEEKFVMRNVLIAMRKHNKSFPCCMQQRKRRTASETNEM